MATTFPACACPADSKLQLLAKTNNGLSSLFFIMSSGLFRGNTVNLGACLCSELQILATLNNNIAAFFTWFSNNGGVPVDPNISTWAQLAAVPTANVAVGAVKIWVDSDTGVLKATQLLAGTDATDTASGIERPNDYDAVTNAKVWYNKIA